MKMPFGKFKGEEVEDIPEGYLFWLWDNVELRTPLLEAVADVLGIGRQSPPSENKKLPPIDMDIAIELVRVGFRQLAKQFHPDVGGSDEKMRKLNAAHEFLKARLGEYHGT